MDLAAGLPTKGLKRCLVIAAVCLPLAGCFHSIPGISAKRQPRRMMGGAGRTATSRCTATLFSVEEEAALEEQGAGRLPSWELMPFRETFDSLQAELTRCVSVVCVGCASSCVDHGTVFSFGSGGVMHGCVNLHRQSQGRGDA